MDTDIATQYWGYMRENLTDAQIKIGLTFIVHELAYWLIYLPFFIAERIPALQKYKLQQTRPFSSIQQWNCFKKILVMHVTLELPLMIIGHFAFHYIGMGMSLPLPSWTSIAKAVVGCFLIEDFYFYWLHRFLHWGPVYRNIHKLHHDHSNPFGMAAEYAHPIETFLLGIGTVLGPIFLINHVFSMHVWVVIRLVQTIECHAGYDFPWSPRQFIPFYGGSEFHDFHHETFKGNYSSTFIIWDHVFGTDVKYRVRRASRAVKGEGARVSIWDSLLYSYLLPTPPIATDKDYTDDQTFASEDKVNERAELSSKETPPVKAKSA